MRACMCTCGCGCMCMYVRLQLPCASGKWSSASGLSSACVNECAAGYFCEPGSTTSNPQACGSAAVYCPAGSGAPLAITPGNFSTGGADSLTRTTSTVCTSGSNYCPGDGLIYSCPVGVYGNASGMFSAACSGPCEAGYFCDVGSTSPTQGTVVLYACCCICCLL